MVTSRHVSTFVNRPAPAVYAVAADPQRLPEWAAGLAGAEVVRDGDAWVTDSPMGRVRIAFAPRNDRPVYCSSCFDKVRAGTLEEPAHA